MAAGDNRRACRPAAAAGSVILNTHKGCQVGQHSTRPVQFWEGKPSNCAHERKGREAKTNKLSLGENDQVYNYKNWFEETKQLYQ